MPLLHRRRTSRQRRRRGRATARREKTPIVIVGVGRAGGALALGLERAGWKVSIFPRSAGSVRRAVALGLRVADQVSVETAAVCILAVPDVAVGEVAASLLADLGASTALVHCAGALPLEALGGDGLGGRARGSFHPLVAISSPEDALAGHAVALSATSKPLLAVLRKMAADLGLRPIEVPEDRRAAYHAGAVLCAGAVVALASAAVEALGEAGISEKDAVAALLPLMRSALHGIEQRGLRGGLTGPVVRGDVEVIRAHLAALPADVAPLYRALSLRSLALAGDRLPPDVRARIEELLRG